MSVSNFKAKNNQKILMHATNDETLDCTTLMNKLFGTFASNESIDNIPLEIVFHIISYLDTTRKYYLAKVLGCLDYFFKKDQYVIKLHNDKDNSEVYLNHDCKLTKFFIAGNIRYLPKLYEFIIRHLSITISHIHFDCYSVYFKYFNKCIIFIKHYSENKMKDVVLIKGFTNNFNFFDSI